MILTVHNSSSFLKHQMKKALFLLLTYDRTIDVEDFSLDFCSYNDVQFNKKYFKHFHIHCLFLNMYGASKSWTRSKISIQANYPQNIIKILDFQRYALACRTVNPISAKFSLFFTTLVIESLNFELNQQCFSIVLIQESGYIFGNARGFPQISRTGKFNDTMNLYLKLLQHMTLSLLFHGIQEYSILIICKRVIFVRY